MLSPRAETILKSIVGQYISNARPVPSQSILADQRLEVCSATIRNEMAHLEQEGYIARPHPSAGSVPLDKGYRCYVDALGDVELPLVDQRLVSHLFHQVEKELNEWLNLAAALLAQMVQNAAIVTTPKSKACQLKHLELVGLQDSMTLVIPVLSGARVREQLITFDQLVSQPELTSVATRLSAAYSGLTSSQISARVTGLSAIEQQVTDCLVKIMEAEDEPEYEKQYLDGLHLMLNQPEFARSQRLLALMELVEQHSLVRSIVPQGLTWGSVRVIIGEENETEAVHDYSVVISRYGLKGEAIGTIGVIGPTRMPYARTMATVSYVASVLSGLAGRLYGKEMPSELNLDATD